jgi:lactate dehydrogenase-like 2-hydroxyacid dehydrogenase
MSIELLIGVCGGFNKCEKENVNEKGIVLIEIPPTCSDALG